MRRLARAFPVAAELVNLFVASLRYGREEANEPTTSPLPPLDQVTNDRVAAEAALRRKWTRWM